VRRDLLLVDELGGAPRGEPGAPRGDEPADGDQPAGGTGR
jgi:hypothetical protein